MSGPSKSAVGSTADVGRDKEQLAADYLVRQGLKTIARNHRCRFGEIDLIMRDGKALAFVEVRYRASTRFGTPAETVTVAKQRRLAAAAADYLRSQPSMLPCRFDVVAIGDHDQIEWIKDAFSAHV
jgi:putative endonuclease